MSDAWFYGGIRSIGKWVCVIDELLEPRVCYLVRGSRRHLRKYLRQEYADALLIAPLIYGTKTIEFEVRYRIGSRT